MILCRNQHTVMNLNAIGQVLGLWNPFAKDYGGINIEIKRFKNYKQWKYQGVYQLNKNASHVTHRTICQYLRSGSSVSLISPKGVIL